MQYLGGKARIAKPLSEFLNAQMQPGQVFVDLFCGSCNVVSNVRQDVERYANDLNSYVTAMFRCLQIGWKPPTEVTREDHAKWKHKVPTCPEEFALKAFIGYGCSFSGVFFGGYAQNKRGDNFCRNAHNSALRKASNMQDVVFSCMDYANFYIPDGSLVYCDIPYKNTAQYIAVGDFDHERFYAWLRKQKHCRVLVSEYKHNVPEGAAIVWEHKSKKGIRNKDGVQEETVEVLFEFPLDKSSDS